MFKKRSIWTLLGILVMVALIATACAPAATEAPPEEVEEAPPPEEEEEMSFEGETVTIFTAAGEAAGYLAKTISLGTSIDG